jgi:hypothetical protein
MDKSTKYRQYKTKARQPVGMKRYGPSAPNTLKKIISQIKGKRLSTKNTNKRKAKNQIIADFLTSRRKGFGSKPLPGGGGKHGSSMRGGNSFKRKVNKSIRSSKSASQTRYSNVNVLKTAFDQLKKKLAKCEQKNKEQKDELSAWKHSMGKLTKKINRGVTFNA